MSILSRPYFRDEEAAHTFLENILWPSGPVCPHCGVIGTAYKIAANPEKRVRYGLWKCKDCRKQFTVKVRTVFEHVRVPLHKALQATYVLCSSKKGVSAHQISRTMEISLKAAWFLMHRIHEGMALHNAAIMGGRGKIAEADETYVGGKEKNKHRNKRQHVGRGGIGKEAVFSLVERGGKVRSHHIQEVSAKTLRPILEAQLDKNSYLMTDSATVYFTAAQAYPNRQTVDHAAGEYVRGNAHTNTVEGYFSILKRGITGVYHHVSQQHLKRYLAEFDFRYNERAALDVDDFARTLKALAGITGKRLTYSQGTNDGKIPV